MIRNHNRLGDRARSKFRFYFIENFTYHIQLFRQMNWQFCLLIIIIIFSMMLYLINILNRNNRELTALEILQKLFILRRD